MSGSSGVFLHVDLAELQLHANRLHAHADDLKQAHDAAARTLTDAQAGFGSGRAAQALRGKIAAWATETADHHRELTDHGFNHTRSSEKFATREQLNRFSIENAGPGGTV
ncbi:WXG100 family type VII secretion target [Mycobacteroides sp. CBMA 271]|uniref:WXG100 family type VII secretion target n=2 Tax=unclassified Mycobacteroides TaxID=2618759 RepID=UPI001FB68A2D|nr:WXG100 family type VII secretion target [Mycobacteroides sp. CBMA 271]